MLFLADEIWITGTLLTTDECFTVIQEAERMNFRIAHQYEISERHNHEVFLEVPIIHQSLQQRLGDEIANLGSRYNHILLRKRLECYRYQQGEYIAPHSDAAVLIEEGIWSKFTLVVYLNDRFQGGKTVFPYHNIVASPPLGAAVLFNQSYLHEASPVEKGTKYVLRTGVALLNT